VRVLPVLLASIVIHAGTARADDEPKSDESHPTSYWHVSFLGGVVKPLGDNADNHDLGLLAGGRIGWSHRVGLGLAISGFYSPLPRKTDPLLPLVTYENHFAVLVGGPQLSLVWKRLRVWMAAGAGLAMERARRFIASGGLVIAGDYTRTFKDLGFSTAPYQLADLSAGIVFLFR